MPKNLIGWNVARGTRALALGAALGLIFTVVPGEQEAMAQCAPAPTNGNDDIACNGGQANAGIDALLGNDTITINNDSVGNAVGEAGDDIIIMNGPNGVVLGIDGDADNDRITVNDGSVTNTVGGGSGNDTIVINNGSVGGDVVGEGGIDSILVTGSAQVFNDVQGGSGNDTITVSASASVVEDVLGEDDGDTITVTDNADIGGVVDGGAGADTISLGGESDVNSAVRGGTENDIISVQGSASVGANVEGNDGNDTITIGASASVVGDVLGGIGIDTILVNGDAEVVGDVDGGAGNDTIAVGDTATIGGSVQGGDDDDVIAVTGSASVAGNVDGDDGNDTITVSGTGSIAGNVFGDAGEDTINISGGGITGDVDAGVGEDSVVIIGGEIGGDVEGGVGEDSINVSGGSIGDDVDGDGGEDTILISGTAVITDKVEGGDGDDSINMSGGGVGDDIEGEAGQDTIVMSGGSVGDRVEGEGGDDSIAISGGSVGLDVEGDEGLDTIEISGTAAIGRHVQGGADNDVISVAGGDIDGNVEGNDGDDTISITGTSIGGDVIGGLGNDTILVDSTTGSIGGSILGDAGTDTLELRSIGVISGGVDAGADNDIVRIHGVNNGENFDAAVAGLTTLEGGAGLDQLEFIGALSELPDSFGGFETIMILDAGLGGSSIDVFQSLDTRTLTADLVFLDFISTLDADTGGATGAGFLTITGDLVNTGFLDMADGVDTDDLIVVEGDYAGDFDGLLFIDAELDATNDADLLVINGAVTDIAVGPPVNTLADGDGTFIIVDDIGSGIGILTGDGPGAGIPVVDVSNTGLTNDDDFFLSGEPIEAGAVEYFLDLESDGIWYLQSVFQDQVFGYAATQSAVNYMTRDYMGTLQERVGTREQTWTGGATKISEGMGVWLRGGGTFGTVNADSNAGAFGLNEYDYDHFFGQLGLDVPFAVTETSRFVGSVFGQAGYGDIKAQDEEGNDAAESEITAYGGGFSITYYGGGEDWAGQPGPHAGAGLYADLVAVFNWYDADVSDTAGADQGHKGTVEGWGWGAGLEVGYGFFLNNGLRLVPQAQLSYSASYLDNFVDDDGIDVDFGDGSSLEVRGGIQVDSGKMWRSGNAYVEANIVHEFLADYDLTVSTLDAGGDLSGTSAELGIGGSFSFVDNVGGYVDIDYRIPFDNGRQGVGAIAGIKVNW